MYHSRVSLLWFKRAREHTNPLPWGFTEVEASKIREGSVPRRDRCEATRRSPQTTPLIIRAKAITTVSGGSFSSTSIVEQQRASLETVETVEWNQATGCPTPANIALCASTQGRKRIERQKHFLFFLFM